MKVASTVIKRANCNAARCNFSSVMGSRNRTEGTYSIQMLGQRKTSLHQNDYDGQEMRMHAAHGIGQIVKES